MSPTVALPIIAFVAALLFTPMTSRLAHLKGWVDLPGIRKVHGVPVAYLGGAAVMCALLTAIAVGALFPGLSLDSSADHSRIKVILVGATVMFAIGLVDDVRNLRATTKLLLQLGAAVLVVASGIRIEGIYLTENIRADFGIFGPLITVLWIVGVTNALNIIDGLDGLCSGLSVVASVAIAWTAVQTDHPAVACLALTLAAAILGFLPYNLPPARVFLGDAGSLSIGFLLAAMSALTASGAATIVGFGVPLAALGVPLLDTAFAMARRMIEGRSILSPDRNHIHHRLLDLGYSSPRTVLTLCAPSAVAVAACALLGGGEVPRVQLILLASLIIHIVAFRYVGAIRLRESIVALGRVASQARGSAKERNALDHLQLSLLTTTDLATWWTVSIQAARDLDISHVSVKRVEAGRPPRACMSHTPSKALPSPALDSDDLVLIIPVARQAVNYIEVRAGIRPNLGSVARRIAAYANLLATDLDRVAPLSVVSPSPQTDLGHRRRSKIRRIDPRSTDQPTEVS